MDFGLHIGTRGPAATGDGLRAIARRAEETGLARTGLNDHVVTAADARAWRDAGAAHLLIGSESDDLASTLDRIDAFAGDVVPLAA